MKSLGMFFFAAIASILFASAALPQSVDFRLCGGAENGNYDRSAHIMKANAAARKVNVVIVNTLGSVDNLDKMQAGECDGAFVQSDAFITYGEKYASLISTVKRVGPIYDEYVHLLCHKDSGIEDITDLTAANIVSVGPIGTGSRVTWDSFNLASQSGWFTSKKYIDVRTTDDNGFPALMDANNEKNRCVLAVSGLSSPFIKTDAPKAGNLVLVGSFDKDMLGVKDASGESVYFEGEIPDNAYPAPPTPKGWTGAYGVDAVGVRALFIVSQAWLKANAKAYDGLIRVYADSIPAFHDLVKPKT